MVGCFNIRFKYSIGLKISSSCDVTNFGEYLHESAIVALARPPPQIHPWLETEKARVNILFRAYPAKSSG